MFSPLCAWVELKSLLGRKLIPSKFLNNQLKKIPWNVPSLDLLLPAKCQVLSLVLELSLEEGIVYTRLFLQFWGPLLFSTKSSGRSDHKYTVFLCGWWKIKSRFDPRQVVWSDPVCLAWIFGLSGDPLVWGRSSCCQHLLLGFTPRSSINEFWGFSGFTGQRCPAKAPSPSILSRSHQVSQHYIFLNPLTFETLFSCKALS